MRLLFFSFSMSLNERVDYIVATVDYGGVLIRHRKRVG